MKNRMLKTILSVVLFTGTATLFAQPNDRNDRQDRQEPPTAAEVIKQMDANKDGKLSKDEVKGPLKDDFAKIDSDKDGFLSLEELKKAPKPERKSKRA